MRAAWRYFAFAHSPCLAAYLRWYARERSRVAARLHSELEQRVYRGCELVIGAGQYVHVRME